MKLIHRLAAAVVVLFAAPAHAGLVDTEITLGVIAQATPTSEPVMISFERSVIVSATEVEYPDLASLFNPGTELPPGFGDGLVDVAIDIGDDFVTIDFANSEPWTQFACAYQNTYVLTFDSNDAVTVVGATIDSSVTTLGLTPQRITVIDNQLHINVQCLTFTPSTYVRLDLTVAGGPRIFGNGFEP